MAKYINDKCKRKHMRVEDFSLEHTLDSGQFFRYSKVGEWYYCQERDKLFKIQQKGNELKFKGTTTNHIKRLFGFLVED